MDYCGAMEEAGAVVHKYKQFGSYQGDWWAKVTYEGKPFWVHGSYGSCTGCDAFMADFGYGEKDKCGEHAYTYPEILGCSACAEAEVGYRNELAAFGARYLTGNDFTQEEAEKEAASCGWDNEGNYIFDFLGYLIDDANISNAIETNEGSVL